MKNLEQDIKQYLEERGWDTLRPGDLAKSISIESAELLEIFQWTNPELEEVENDPAKITAIKKELADVLIYCIDISVLLGLDTEKLIREKLELVRKKYPAELMKNHDKEPGSDSAYLKIKQEYRQKGL